MGKMRMLKKTCNNLRTMVSVFFHFPDTILDLDQSIEFATFLCCNTSYLEYQCLDNRARGVGTSQKHNSVVLRIENQITNMSLRTHKKNA